MLIQNFRIKLSDFKTRVEETGDFIIRKNNGVIKFEVNCKAWNKKGDRFADRFKVRYLTIYTVKVLDKNNKVKYIYCLNFDRTCQEIKIESFNKSKNEALENLIMKQLRVELTGKLKLRSRKIEVFFDVWEPCYYI